MACLLRSGRYLETGFVQELTTCSTTGAYPTPYQLQIWTQLAYSVGKVKNWHANLIAIHADSGYLVATPWPDAVVGRISSTDTLIAWARAYRRAAIGQRADSRRFCRPISAGDCGRGRRRAEASAAGAGTRSG